MSGITFTGLPGVELSDMLPKLGTQVFSSSNRNLHRREQAIRERDRKVGERGKFQNDIDGGRGRRWAVLEPFYGDEPGIGSFHEPLCVGELTIAEVWELIRRDDEKIYGEEIEKYRTSSDPEFGTHRLMQKVEGSLEPELRWVDIEPIDEAETEVIMVTNGGANADEVWWEDRQATDDEDDLDHLLPANHGYCLAGLRVA